MEFTLASELKKRFERHKIASQRALHGTQLIAAGAFIPGGTAGNVFHEDNGDNIAYFVGFVITVERVLGGGGQGRTQTKQQGEGE